MDTLQNSSTDTNSINEASVASNIKVPDKKEISQESVLLICQEIQIGKFKFLPSLKSDHIMVTVTKNGFHFEVPSMNKTPPTFELKAELITQVSSYFSSSLCAISVEMDLKGSEKIRDKLDICDSAILCSEPEYEDNINTFFILSPQSFDERISLSDYLSNKFSVYKNISNVKVAESLFKNFIPSSDVNKLNANPQKVKIVSIKVHSEKDLVEEQGSVEGKSMSFKVTQSKHLVRCDDIPSSIGDAQIKVKRKTVFCYAIRNRSFEIKSANEKSSIFVWLNPNGIFFQIPDFNTIQSVTISHTDIVEISGYISYEFYVRFFAVVVTDECIRRIYSQLGLEKLEKSKDVIMDKMFNRIVFIIECAESASYAIALQKYLMTEFELSYKYTVLEPNEATRIFKECTPHKGLPFKELLPQRPSSSTLQQKLVMLFCSSIRIGLRQYLAPQSPPYLIVRMSRNKFYFRFPRVKKGFEKPLFVEMNDIAHVYGHVCCCVPFISLKLSQLCSERIKRELGLPYNRDVRNFYDGKQLRITFEVCCHKKFKPCMEAQYFLRESVKIIESQESECQEKTEKEKNKTFSFPSQAEPYVKTDRIARLEKRLKRKICEGTDVPRVILKRSHFIEQLVKTGHTLKLGKDLQEEFSEEKVIEKQPKIVKKKLDINYEGEKFKGKEIAASSTVPESEKESSGNNLPCSEKQSNGMLTDIKQEPEDDYESSNSSSKHSLILPDVQIEKSNDDDYENVEKILGNIDHPQIKEESVDNDKGCQNGYAVNVPHPSPLTNSRDQTANKTKSKCINLPLKLKDLLMTKNASVKVVNVSPNNPQQHKVYKLQSNLYNPTVAKMPSIKKVPCTSAPPLPALSQPIRFVNTKIAPKSTPVIVNTPVASNLPRPPSIYTQSTFRSTLPQSSSSVQFKPLSPQGNTRSVLIMKPSSFLNSSPSQPSTSSSSMPFKIQSIVINRNGNASQNQTIPQNLPYNVILKTLSSLPVEVRSQLAQGKNAVLLNKPLNTSELSSSTKPVLSQLLTTPLISSNSTTSSTSQRDKLLQLNDTGQNTKNTTTSANATVVNNKTVLYTSSVANSDAKASSRVFTRPVSITQLKDTLESASKSYKSGGAQFPSTEKRKLESSDDQNAKRFASECLNRLQQKSVNSAQWTKEEENTVLEAYQSCGEQWSLIAEVLGGRTASEVKEYYMSNLNSGNRRKSARISQRYTDKAKRQLELKKRLLQQIAEGTERKLKVVLKKLDVRSLKSTFKIRYLTSEAGELNIPEPNQSSSDKNQQHSKTSQSYKIKYIPVPKTVVKQNPSFGLPSRSNFALYSEDRFRSVKFINVKKSERISVVQNNQQNQNKTITSQPSKTIRHPNVVILPSTLKPLINYAGSSVTQPICSNSSYGNAVNKPMVKANPLVRATSSPITQHAYNRSFPYYGLNKTVLPSKPFMALKSCALAKPSCSGSSYEGTVNKPIIKAAVPYINISNNNLSKPTCSNSSLNTAVTKTFVKIISPLVTASSGSFILPTSSNSSYDSTVNKNTVKPINPLSTVSSGSFILPTCNNSPYGNTVSEDIVKSVNSSDNSSTSFVQSSLGQSTHVSSNSDNNDVNSDDNNTDDGIIASDFLEVVLEEKEESNVEIPTVHETEPSSSALLQSNDSFSQAQYILPSLSPNNIILQPSYNQSSSDNSLIVPDNTVLTSTLINSPPMHAFQRHMNKSTKPFIKYCSQHWETMRDCNPNLGMKELLFAFKYMWEVLSPDFKKMYTDACENEEVKLPSTVPLQHLPKCAIPRSSLMGAVPKNPQACAIKTKLGAQPTPVSTKVNQSSENSQPLESNQKMPYQENDTSTSTSQNNDDDDKLSKFLEFESSFMKKVAQGIAPKAKIVLEELDPILLKKRREIIRRRDDSTKSQEHE